MRIAQSASIVGAVALLTGCGGGDSTDVDVGGTVGAIVSTVEEGPLSEAIAGAVLDANANVEGGMVVTEPEARCLAEQAVVDHGADRLLELGADEQDLLALRWTPAEGDVVYLSLQKCVDLHASVAQLFASDPTLSTEQVDCLAEAYLASGVLRFALFSREPDPEIDAKVDVALAGAVNACL